MYNIEDTTKVVAGIDVGKASLDVSVNAGSVRRYSNTPVGIIELLKWLKSEEVSLRYVSRPEGMKEGW